MFELRTSTITWKNRVASIMYVCMVATYMYEVTQANLNMDTFYIHDAERTKKKIIMKLILSYLCKFYEALVQWVYFPANCKTSDRVGHPVFRVLKWDMWFWNDTYANDWWGNIYIVPERAALNNSKLNNWDEFV